MSLRDLPFLCVMFVVSERGHVMSRVLFLHQPNSPRWNQHGKTIKSCKSHHTRSHCPVPFLFVDNNLGVPHKLAYKAYLEAVARFRAVRPPHNASDCSRNHSAELLASSAVLLLVNPVAGAGAAPAFVAAHVVPLLEQHTGSAVTAHTTAVSHSSRLR